MIDTALKKLSEVGSYTCALESVEDVRKFTTRGSGGLPKAEVPSVVAEVAWFDGVGRL